MSEIGDQAADRGHKWNRLSWKSVGAVVGALAVGFGMGRVTAEGKSCEEMTVFAQHKFPPDGASERIAPYKDARVVRILNGNDPLVVKGYVKINEPTFEENPDPLKGEYWFHVVKPEEGWVNNAAVRAAIIPPAQFDPTGMDTDNGPLVPILPECDLIKGG